MTSFALGNVRPQWSITTVLVTTGIYLAVQFFLIRRSRELGLPDDVFGSSAKSMSQVVIVMTATVWLASCQAFQASQCW